MSKVSLNSQIGALAAVISGRFPGTMSISQRALTIEHLSAAERSLKWLQANEADVRAYVAARKEPKT